ncbi:MAG: response regulator [Anaerolineae bacterium]|nr:response regulator [Anaerolineae bacterium]MDW8172809.1 response regulator [Anaerolineae bacterium]
MARPVILVVEDNRDNMILIADVLSSLDYEVVQARDGEQGLALAQQSKPDLILMDLSLPRMDGWATTRELRKLPDFQSLPIIALTAHAMSGDRERALQAGCTDYISKPINLQELARKLKQHLQLGEDNS